jgi:hypothetical protein
MADYVFHVLHNARPEYEQDILALLQDGNESTYEEMLDEGRSLGFAIGHQVKTERQLKDVLQLLRDLDLMERRQIKLTPKGQVVARISSHNSELFPEIIHYLYYSAWTAMDETDNCFSWSYRTLCNFLWQQGTATIDKNLLFSVVSSEASGHFNIQSVSFSTSSVTGILIWLGSLIPPVIEEQNGNSEAIFSRRAFCSPELFVLAVDFVYRQETIDYSVNLLLSEQRRDAICQVCLLEPSNFERVLDYAVAQFDYLEKGMGGGWGHYLTLYRHPELTDFVP